MGGSKPPWRMLSMTSADCSGAGRGLELLLGLGRRAVGTAQIDHEVTTRSGKPASAKVGVSGAAGERWAPVEATGFSLPALTWPIRESILAMQSGTWPASTSAAAAEAPR